MNNVIASVDVEVSRDTIASDPISFYKSCADRLGPEHAFILESLSGPSRDCKSSVVGVESILSISIYEKYAVLEADKALKDFLIISLRISGFSANEDGRIDGIKADGVWQLLRSIRDSFLLPKSGQQGMAFFGYFSYDSIRFIENIPSLTKIENNHPIISLKIFRSLIYFHANGEREVVINNCELWSEGKISQYRDLIDRVNEVEDCSEVEYPDTDAIVYSSVERDEFKGWVKTALHHISIGDIYQTQLGHDIKIESSIKPFDVYQALRKKNPSPYMYLANLGGIDLIGASPELFVRMIDGLIEMRPIAGTVGKRTGVEPTELIKSMTRSEKERAEHIMLVDLCRNDVARVCQPNSLEVDELMIVEEYSHLYHMVSNVRGLLSNGHDAFDVIKASFPAGTMTGAPKVRAMELIESIEKNRRGVYAGCVGLIGFNGDVNTALCIRSAIHDNGKYLIRASAGIVSDSIPELEWNETLYKMSSIYRAITNKELMK